MHTWILWAATVHKCGREELTLSEVRGSGPEFQAATAQERPAERSHLTSEVGAVAESSRLRQCRRSREELPLPEARGDGGEELPKA